MTHRLALPALIVLALLSGCGNRRALKPQPGHDLPIAPYGQGHRPSADELLKAPVETRPERNVDTRTRSEERADDPFDLPPEG